MGERDGQLVCHIDRRQRGRDGGMREVTEGEPTLKINLHSQLLLPCNHSGNSGQRLEERPGGGGKQKHNATPPKTRLATRMSENKRPLKLHG